MKDELTMNMTMIYYKHRRSFSWVVSMNFVVYKQSKLLWKEEKELKPNSISGQFVIAVNSSAAELTKT